MKWTVFQVVAMLAFVLPSAANAACEPPAGFKPPAPPEEKQGDVLVSRVEEVVVERKLKTFMAAIAKLDLQDYVYPAAALPRITGMYRFPLEAGGKPYFASFGSSKIGTQRLACWSDGSTVMETSLHNEKTDTSLDYKYKVWDYTSPAFPPIVYGIGHIQYAQTPGGHTVVTWTYSFKLDESKDPAWAGEAGREKFRTEFLGGPFGEIMRGTLAIWKVRVESEKDL